MRALLEKGVPLTPAEAGEAARSLHYAQFEDAFRGTPEAVRKGQEPYLELLGDRRPVLDLGCGRGEFLELLKSRGIPCLGVERDAALAAALQFRGLPFERADTFAFLQKDGPKFGAVTAFHFIEHFTAADARDLLRLAYDRLQPGGMLLLETPNPASLAAFLNWHKDPDHRTPWHPEALRFYLEQAGLKEVQVRFLHPFPPRPELHLAGAAEELLFGFQDYAVWGVKPE
jgi:O-antigen chain-terminating methyltransferase